MRTEILFDEPPIDEMLADPIVRLVMRRDRIGPGEVRAAIEAARRKLSLRSGNCAADPLDRRLPSGI